MLDLPDEVKDDLTQIGTDLDTVLEDVVIQSKVADFFADLTSKNIIFHGKSLALWEDEMVVAIPSSGELTPDEIRTLHIELANKTQIASHYYEISRAAATISASAFNVKKADLITALVNHHILTGQSVPPATVMERIIDGYVRSFSSMTSIHKVAKDFWRGKLETLEKVTNHLEKISMSLVTELKYLSQEA